MEISDLKRLVEAGARLLDEKKPGWYDKFTAETWRQFDMWDEYHDILGTIFGSFHVGTASLFPDSCNRYTMAEKHGFDCTKHYDGDARHDLETLWYEMIIDRQENGVPNEQTLRRRMYHVQPNTWTTGEYDVVRQVEGSQNFETIETYGSEIMAARVAAHLQSFANADYQMRLDALAKKANS